MYTVKSTTKLSVLQSVRYGDGPNEGDLTDNTKKDMREMIKAVEALILERTCNGKSTELLIIDTADGNVAFRLQSRNFDSKHDEITGG